MDHFSVVTCWNSFVLLDCDDRNDYPETLPLEELEYGEAIWVFRAVANRVANPHGSHFCYKFDRTKSPRKRQEFGPMQWNQWSRAAPKFVACFYSSFRWFRGEKSAECGIQEKIIQCHVYIFDIYNMMQWIYVRTVICKFLCLASWRSVQSQGFKEEWCLSLKRRQLKRQLKTRNEIPATTELGEAYRKMM